MLRTVTLGLQVAAVCCVSIAVDHSNEGIEIDISMTLWQYHAETTDTKPDDEYMLPNEDVTHRWFGNEEVDENLSHIQNIYLLSCIFTMLTFFYSSTLLLCILCRYFSYISSRIPWILSMNISLFMAFCAVSMYFCSAVAFFSFFGHPQSMHSDWEPMTGTDVKCGDICKNFWGNQEDGDKIWGPREGWYFMGMAHMCFGWLVFITIRYRFPRLHHGVYQTVI